MSTGAAPLTAIVSCRDRERRAALRGQIAAGIGGIDLLDEEILDIGGRRREAPGDPLVVADHDQRDARRGAAGDLVLRRLQPREIPEARRGKAEMRVVGEQRLAAGAVRAVDDPVVRGVIRPDDRAAAPS